MMYHSFVCESGPRADDLQLIDQDCTTLSNLCMGLNVSSRLHKLRHVFRVPDQEILYTTSTVIFP